MKKKEENPVIHFLSAFFHAILAIPTLAIHLWEEGDQFSKVLGALLFSVILAAAGACAFIIIVFAILFRWH